MNNMDKERIEKDALTYADSTDRRGTSAHYGLQVGYISGATAEHERLQQLIEGKQRVIANDSKIKNELHEKLKAAQELNRELLDSISQLMYAMNSTGLPWNTDSTVEKAYAKCKAIIKQKIG